MPLHITKIAFGCDSPAQLRAALESRSPEARLTTRYMPKRADEMAGGSLYWIFASTLIGRSPILGFMENGEGRYFIRLEPRLIPVISTPKRPHQGWRYLEDIVAPPDLGAGESEGAEAMPGQMLGDLMKMGLV